MNFHHSSRVVGRVNVSRFSISSFFLPFLDPMSKTIPPSLVTQNSNPTNEKQCIIKNKNDKIFCEKDRQQFFDSNEFIANKKLISVSPGGIRGFYLLGVLSFIKETYDLDDYIYSGASAGAWNSLFMCYQKDPRDLIFKKLNTDMMKAKNIYDIEYMMKYKLLELCKEEDFDLRRLFIGVTSLRKFQPLTTIFSDFDHLEDAINCCIASSHIPLITGGLTNRYHNMYTFDGGFSNYPYLSLKTPVLHVSPSMWKEIKEKESSVPFFMQQKIKRLTAFYHLVSENKKNVHFMKLYDDGYYDAKENRKYLDEIFLDDYSEI
jgi:predicted patatin/cPLA2 family phospholipase